MPYTTRSNRVVRPPARLIDELSASAAAPRTTSRRNTATRQNRATRPAERTSRSARSTATRSARTPARTQARAPARTQARAPAKRATKTAGSRPAKVQETKSARTGGRKGTRQKKSGTGECGYLSSSDQVTFQVINSLQVHPAVTRAFLKGRGGREEVRHRHHNDETCE
ncbi:hypothetical protein EV356DRAFT_386734 [Viridothelium virens]|uniref:Uncharacterized protein n=1 Tax=Viridothelium virens TaxID=1048519 RepID=A0A6A6GUQ5_VIRVR|nr:hypothetical protein EV356DRAFT_386734 [Viridothelium virens]